MALEPVTFDELNTLKGIDTTKTIQEQIDTVVIPTALADGKIFVGNGDDEPTAVDMSGDVAITNAGVTSIASATITGKLLTGLAAGADTSILATDTILEALAKLQAQIDAL